MFAVLLALVGGSAILCSAVATSASLRLESTTAFGLAVYLLAWAEVVAATEVLSLFRAVSVGGYLAFETVVLAAAVAWWLRAGRPSPPIARIEPMRSARAHPVVAILFVVCASAIVYEAVVGMTTPPTTLDELWYHLSRAAAWLQHGGVYHIPGGNAAENDYPPNAEMAVLYGLVFVHRETFATVPQLVAQVAGVLAIFGIARRLGSPKAPALFAGLLFVTLSGVAVDAMTALNDIVVGSFVAAAAYFMVVARARAATAFCGLALGLALGTKYTALFALPCLLLLIPAVVPRSRMVSLAAWTVLAFAAVGAYGYVENLVDSNAVLGAGAREIGTSTAAVTARGTVSTMARNLYRFGDLPGYRVKTRWLDPLATVGRHAFSALQIPTAPPEASTGGSPFLFEINVESNTGAAWYGPLGWLLIIPLSIGFAVAWGLRKAGRARGALALWLPIYLLVTAMVYRYTSNGRFFITPIMATLPLAAFLYRFRWLANASMALAALTLFFALAYDSEKPSGLGAGRSIWDLSRPEAESLSVSPGAANVIEAVDRLPAREPLGFDAPQLYFGYALYGSKLQRKLVALTPGDPLADATRRGVRAVYFGANVPVPADAPGWTTESFGQAGTLLTRRR